MIRAGFDGFFDRAALRQQLGRAKLTYYTRSGAYVRRVAQNSIRVRKRPLTKSERAARVGQPPTSRTRFFKQSILFGYDAASDGVLIGPTGGKKDPSPAAFEQGGTYPIRIRTRRGIRRTVGRYRRFPTMGPALRAATPKLAAFWEATIGS